MKLKDILYAIKIGLGVAVSLTSGKTSKILKKSEEVITITRAVERVVKKKK